jgi:hypothetical protein
LRFVLVELRAQATNKFLNVGSPMMRAGRFIRRVRGQVQPMPEISVMKKRFSVSCALAALLSLTLVLGFAPQGWGQNNNNNGGNNNGGNNNNNGGNNGGGGGNLPAGVMVSPDGVLRVKQIRDASGTLTKKWQAEAKARLGGDLANPSAMRKISLNRLEAALAARVAKGQGPTDEMKALAGLTRLQYVFFYPDSNDIVIAGSAEGFAPDATGRLVGIHTGQAVLQLDDMIVALRAFPPSGDPTNVISVSIDPTAAGLQKMQQFLVSIAGRVRPGDAGTIVAGLKQNLGLQNVTVDGISAKSHFAQVLVEADYRMKLIGIGMEEPPVKIASYVSRANPRDVSRNALQRWYFVPNYDCVRVTADELAMELVGDGVKLIGANELVQADGSRANAAVGNRASEAFCASFTALYPQLARRSPVYAQMRNLIDMSIAAAYIQRQDYYGQAGWKMELLGDEQRMPVETYEAPRTVETACTAIWKGNTLMTPVGGGVRIEATQAIAKDRRLPDEQGQLKATRQKVSLQGLDANQWWWD